MENYKKWDSIKPKKNCSERKTSRYNIIFMSFEIMPHINENEYAHNSLAMNYLWIYMRLEKKSNISYFSIRKLKSRIYRL